MYTEDSILDRMLEETKSSTEGTEEAVSIETEREAQTIKHR